MLAAVGLGQIVWAHVSMGEGAALFGVRSIPDKPDERVFTRCTLERCERAAGEGESDVTVHCEGRRDILGTAPTPVAHWHEDTNGQHYTG